VAPRWVPPVPASEEASLTSRLTYSPASLAPLRCARVGKFSTMELGNGDISDDGTTFYASWMSGADLTPLLMAVDVGTGAVLHEWAVPPSLREEMLVADVAVCA
jgi:hypothetical protein